MPDPTGPSSTAEGTLGSTPFAHLLVYMADRMLSGSLRFVSDQPDGRTTDHIVHFQQGAPAKVRTGEPVAYLGRVLFELGLIDQATLDRSLLEVSKTKELHGEHLIRVGAIDKEGLLAGLRIQAARKLEYLFGLSPTTRYQFYADVNLLEHWGGPELVALDPLPLIWNAVCARADERTVATTLARLGQATLRMHPESDASRFGFDSAQLEVVDLIRASPRSLASLIEADVAQQLTTRLGVYVLLVTRHLDHGAAAPPPVGLSHVPASTRMRAAKPIEGVTVARVKLKPIRIQASPGPDAAVAPTRPAADLTSRTKAITDRAAAIEGEDYFAMLGVPRDAPEAEIQSAYFTLAKSWHPDRLPSELADVKDAATKVFARMSEAFETLSDAARRKKYLETLSAGDGTPEEVEQVQRVLNATADYQRAEVYFRKHDFAKALFHVKRAYEADPEQADYAGLYAVILAEQRNTAGAAFDDLLEMLDRAIEKNERSERARLARAEIRKRAGDLQGALADYRLVLETNPKNVEAGREVRLYEMRRQKQTESKPAAEAPAPGKGVLAGLGKLFKR
jgi:curved DNA-binding protein CbpA